MGKRQHRFGTLQNWKQSQHQYHLTTELISCTYKKCERYVDTDKRAWNDPHFAASCWNFVFKGEIYVRKRRERWSMRRYRFRWWIIHQISRQWILQVILPRKLNWKLDFNLHFVCWHKKLFLKGAGYIFRSQVTSGNDITYLYVTRNI